VTTLVYEPPEQHTCGVRRDGTWSLLYDPPGTVRACDECGRTWVAEKPPPGLMPSVWRPEGRIARWRRERRERTTR